MPSTKKLLEWELKLAFRSGGNIANTLFFFSIIIILVPLGIGNSVIAHKEIAPGIIWIAALLAVLLSLDRIFQNDLEDGSLEILYLSPVPLEIVVMIKMVAHWFTTGLPLAVLSPILAISLNLPIDLIPWLLASLLLGTPALSFIGTIGASLTLNMRRSGLLKSILILPLYIPTLIFGSQVISLTMGNKSSYEAIIFLTAISLITLAIAPIVTAIAIKAHWRY